MASYKVQRNRQRNRRTVGVDGPVDRVGAGVRSVREATGRVVRRLPPAVRRARDQRRAAQREAFLARVHGAAVNWNDSSGPRRAVHAAPRVLLHRQDLELTVGDRRRQRAASHHRPRNCQNTSKTSVNTSFPCQPDQPSTESRHRVSKTKLDKLSTCNTFLSERVRINSNQGDRALQRVPLCLGTRFILRVFLPYYLTSVCFVNFSHCSRKC